MDDAKFLEALDNFFKLKSAYESSYKKKINKIIGNHTLSVREKRKRIQGLDHKCINCKRPVGTLFSNKDRHYKAICGDIQEPCGLNIDLEKGNIINVEKAVDYMQEVINSDITNIIKTKLDLLFNFTDEAMALENFDKAKQVFSVNNKIYSHYNIDLNNIIDNPEKKEAIKGLQATLNITISEFKNLMKNYEKNGVRTLLKDAIDLYLKQLIPQTEKIQKNQYVFMGMASDINSDTKDKTFHLIQTPYSITQLEDTIQTPKILSNKK